MKYSLVSDVLPNYSPQTERSDGIHLSDIIRDISLCNGYYEYQPRPSRQLVNKWRLGLANEYAFIRQLDEESPGQYMSIGEIEYEGIFMNLDLYGVALHSADEFKVSWMSSRHTPDSEKLWPYLAQIMGYCQAINSITSNLRVVYVRDDYRTNEVGYRHWRFTFSRRELRRAWDGLRAHADTLCPNCKLTRYCMCRSGKATKKTTIVVGTTACSLAA